MSPIDSASARTSRYDIIDIARGLALVGMFVFHFGWDLSFLGLVDIDILGDWRWRWLARLVAGSFLFLTGFSLVLATRRGLNLPGYLRRLGQIVLAAGLVSLGTWLAIPEAFVKFGILHHIALASVVALALLRWPVPAIIAAALLALALPQLVASGWIRAGFFELPAFSWLGLAAQPQQAVDFVPVFPWIGFVFLGLALARIMLARGTLPAAPAGNLLTRLLAFGGRHSLLVYLIHQPVFIGLLVGLSFILARADLPDPEKFTRTCEQACISTGLAVDNCQISCACSMNRIKAENLWDKTMSARLSPAEEARIHEIARICLKLN